VNASDVAKTLKSSGFAMTLTRTTPGAYDPITGSVDTAIEQTWTVYGITGNYGRFNMGNSFNDANSMVLSGDKKVIIGAGVVEPLPADVITIMGVDWIAISVDTLCPRGEALMYTIQARK